jgi:hypothetical protein
MKTHLGSSLFGWMLLACAIAGLNSPVAYGQSTSSAPQNPPPPAVVPMPSMHRRADADETHAVGAAVKVSTLGVGVEVATPVLRRANLRAAFNILGYSKTFNKDGIGYDAHLAFKTVEGHFDFFPWAGNFHVGPGVLGYIGDPIKAHAVVASNQSFTLGGVTYYSDPTNNTGVAGKIDFDSVVPMITFGWGNLVPRRKSKHFSVPFEMGVAFQGAPKSTLSLTGNVCEAPGVSCQSVAGNPTVAANVVSEQNKLNNSMSVFKAYPIISLGVGYKF